MKNASLAELVHLNLAETLREITRRSAGIILERDGVLLYAAGPGDPGLWNGAVRINPQLGAGEILTMADEFFRELGRGYALHTFDQLDQDLDEALQQAGRQPQVAAPEMILETPMAEIELPADAVIEEVSDDQGREDFLVVVTAAFKTLGVEPEIWRRAYPEISSLAAPHIAAVVTYVDGAPAAAAMIYLSHAIAEIVHVGAHPDYRRRGLGELVTRAVTGEGFNRGARLASLPATPMADSLYRRMGYQEIGRYQWYIFPPK